MLNPLPPPPHTHTYSHTHSLPTNSHVFRPTPHSEMEGDLKTWTDCLEYFGGSAAAQQKGETHDFSDGSFVYTRREPLGVCVGIGAFNYPGQSCIWKAAPALVFGNAMVFKPAGITPHTALALAEIFVQAGLPKGVFSVLLGDGVLGSALINSPHVSKISFTGSVATGSKIAAQASSEVKKITLELGGKSPMIVFEDCDVEAAVTGAMMANFLSNGQVCSNGTRVFVQEKIYDRFVQRLVERTKRLKIGDPMDFKTEVGPMITKSHRDKVVGFVERAIKQGAKLGCGGTALSSPDELMNPKDFASFKNGAFMLPAVFYDVEDDFEIAREEIFGPVASVLKFKTEEEVVQRANDSEFGLAAGVYTNNLTRAHRVVHAIKAGQCWINNFNLSPAEIPWGGYKKSGLGRENGTEAVHYWTQVKTVHVEIGGAADAFDSTKAAKL